MPAAVSEIGSQIQRANGTTGLVAAIEFSYHSQLMYNLTVATAHTYFVGERQWLVHNSCPNLSSRPFASNADLNRGLIEQMYRGDWVNGQWVSADQYAGGLAGAIRKQLSDGELVGGVDHLPKVKRD